MCIVQARQASFFSPAASVPQPSNRFIQGLGGDMDGDGWVGGWMGYLLCIKNQEKERTNNQFFDGMLFSFLIRIDFLIIY